jgi:hypothetical protein
MSEPDTRSPVAKLLDERRASGWLPVGGIALAVKQPAEQVEQGLRGYGNPKVDADGAHFRWNWVYEWAATQFEPGPHTDYIRETAEGILQQAGGDMDRALKAALVHTSKLWAAEVVEVVLEIEG